MTKKLTMFVVSITLISVALLLFGPATSMAGPPGKPKLPPVWKETPVTKSQPSFTWVDDEYYGNCRDKNNQIQCGDVWHKEYSNGNRSNPYLDKQILCAGVAGQGCPKKERSQDNLDKYKGYKQ